MISKLDFLFAWSKREHKPGVKYGHILLVGLVEYVPVHPVTGVPVHPAHCLKTALLDMFVCLQTWDACLLTSFAHTKGSHCKGKQEVTSEQESVYLQRNKKKKNGNSSKT